MRLYQQLLSEIQDGEILDVRIGLNWTAVVADVAGSTRCGLAATLSDTGSHTHKEPPVPHAGMLDSFSGRQLAENVFSEKPVMVSLGMAAINALLPQTPQAWVEANAEEVIAERGAGKRVVMVGHFPFVERVRPRLGELLVLEQDPQPGDLPAEEAPHVLPSADVVAITGMTILNGTLEGLLSLCPAQAYVMLLGPTTPLSARLFDNGLQLISGAVVTDIEPVLRVVSQGGNFHQVHHAGVRLVNMTCQRDQALD
jgi:uncharacterized protein (DUF4213/DUF364 family)